MRRLAWLFLLLVVGCTPDAPKPKGKSVASTAPSDQRQALTALKAQAQEIGQAAIREDHTKMAQLTHPALVEKFGGQAAYVKKLDSTATEMKQQGFRLKAFTVGEPSELVQAGGRLYAVVPQEVQLSGPQGAAGRRASFLVAVSADGGSHWQFVDGSGVRGDRSKLKMLFPEFPDRLQLPADQPAVWDGK